MDERIEAVAQHLSERILALQELLLEVRSRTRGFAEAYERLERWADRAGRLIAQDLGDDEAQKFARVGRGTMHVQKLSGFTQICEEYTGFLQALYEDVLQNPDEWLQSGNVQPEGRVLEAILFSDIVGSTEHIGKVGDSVWRNERNEHYRVSTEVVEQFGGRVISRTGDGVLATFALPTSAVGAALELQKRMRDMQLPLRVGIHVGEVDVGDGDVSGLAVHVAARLLDGNDGTILATEAVRESAVGSTFGFSDAGTRQLRGLQGTWQLFEVNEDASVTSTRTLTSTQQTERLKELLDLILQLKDAAFAADVAGLRWSNDMANAEFKMRTTLGQLPADALPVRVREFSTAHAAQVITAWQTVYHQVEQVLLGGGR